MPLAAHPLLGGNGGDLTVFKYLGLACSLYAVYYLYALRTLELPAFRTWTCRFFIAFLLIAIISSISASLRQVEFAPLFSFTSFLSLFFISSVLIDSARRLRRALIAVGASVALASLYTIREWQLYHHVYAGFRPGFISGDSNYFAISALQCLPIAYYMVLDPKSHWDRWFWSGCLVSLLAAFALASSRGGFLGMLAALLFIVWNSRRRFRNLSFSCLLLVPVMFFVPQSPLDRILHPTYSDEVGRHAREVTWKAGIRMIRQHPISGVGLGNFKLLVLSYEDPGEHVVNMAHNTYIEIAAEMGIPALLLFLGIIGAAFSMLNTVRKRTTGSGPSLVRQTALALQASIIGCSVAIFFCPGTYQKAVWLNMALALALPPLVPHRVRQRRTRVVAPPERTSGRPVLKLRYTQ
jgi:O-antigen ligase